MKTVQPKKKQSKTKRRLITGTQSPSPPSPPLNHSITTQSSSHILHAGWRRGVRGWWGLEISNPPYSSLYSFDVTCPFLFFSSLPSFFQPKNRPKRKSEVSKIFTFYFYFHNHATRFPFISMKFIRRTQP